MSSKKSRGRSPDPRKSPPPKTPPAAGRRAAKKGMESEMTTGQRLERLRLGLGGKESDDRAPASEKVDASASTGENIDTPAPTGKDVAASATESKSIASEEDRQRLLAASRELNTVPSWLEEQAQRAASATATNASLEELLLAAEIPVDNLETVNRVRDGNEVDADKCRKATEDIDTARNSQMTHLMSKLFGSSPSVQNEGTGRTANEPEEQAKALIRKWEDDNTRTVPLEKPKPRPQDSRARATIPPTGANQAVVGAAISAQTRARSSSRSRNKRKKAEGIAVASGYKSIAEKVMDGTIQDGTKPGPGVIKAVTEAVNANPKVFSQVSPLKLRDGYSWANIPRLDGENYGRFLALRDMFNIGLNKSRLHPKFEGWAEACEQVQATKYGKDVLNTFLAWKAANPKPEMKSKAKSGTAGSDGFTSP